MKKPRVEIRNVVAALQELNATVTTKQIPEYMLIRQLIRSNVDQWSNYSNGRKVARVANPYIEGVLHKFCQKPRKYPVRRRLTEGTYYYWLEER